MLSCCGVYFCVLVCVTAYCLAVGVRRVLVVVAAVVCDLLLLVRWLVFVLRCLLFVVCCVLVVDVVVACGHCCCWILLIEVLRC